MNNHLDINRLWRLFVSRKQLRLDHVAVSKVVFAFSEEKNLFIHFKDISMEV